MFSAAVASAGAAAVLLALGALVPVVAGASPGFASPPLLIVLALAPMALAGVFARKGRVMAAAGVLAGVAAPAPGRLVADLEFLVDPSAVARPELYRPVVFALPGPATGIWLMLAGLVATAVAGVLAALAAAPRSEAHVAGRGPLLIGLLGAMVAAVGLMMSPFSSDDAFLPAGSAFESPALVLAGSLLLAFALPVAAAFVITAGAAEVALGGQLGLALGAATVALPDLVSGMAVSGVRPAAGPIVVLVGAAGLVLAAFLRAGDREGSAERESPAAEITEIAVAGEARLPESPRLRLATGLLGLATMVTALIGALAPQVVVVGGQAGPHSPARWLLLAAGLVAGVLSVAMFVPSLASTVRPALSVSWAGVAMAATAVLTTAITASELGAGLGPGPGAPWTAVSVVCAVATACCSVVTGMVERDNADDAGDRLPGPGLLTPLVAAGILAVGAFGTPSIAGTEYTEPALWSDFGTPSWGLLIALLTVVGACVLAPRCRRARAAAMLAGAAAVAALRLLALPLGGSQIPGAHAGVGWWLTLGCLVALVAAVVTAAAGRASQPSK